MSVCPGPVANWPESGQSSSRTRPRGLPRTRSLPRMSVLPAGQARESIPGDGMRGKPGTCAHGRSRSDDDPRGPRLCPTVGRPGRTQPPCGGDHAQRRGQAGSGQPPRTCPSPPRHSGHGSVRCMLPPSPRSLQPRQKRVRTEVPSGLAASSVGGSRRPQEAHGRLALMSAGTGRWDIRAAACAPSRYRLPAGCTERDGIGIGNSGLASAGRGCTYAALAVLTPAPSRCIHGITPGN